MRRDIARTCISHPAHAACDATGNRTRANLEKNWQYGQFHQMPHRANLPWKPPRHARKTCPKSKTHARGNRARYRAKFSASTADETKRAKSQSLEIPHGRGSERLVRLQMVNLPGSQAIRRMITPLCSLLVILPSVAVPHNITDDSTTSHAAANTVNPAIFTAAGLLKE